jgi:hypothetical protein
MTILAKPRNIKAPNYRIEGRRRHAVNATFFHILPPREQLLASLGD